MIYKRKNFVGFTVFLNLYFNTAKCQNIVNFKSFYEKNLFFYPFFKKAASICFFKNNFHTSIKTLNQAFLSFFIVCNCAR